MIGRTIIFTPDSIVYDGESHQIRQVNVGWCDEEEYLRGSGTIGPLMHFKDLGYTGSQRLLYNYYLHFKDGYGGIGTFVDYFDESFVLVGREDIKYKLRKVE